MATTQSTTEEVKAILSALLDEHQRGRPLPPPPSNCVIGPNHPAMRRRSSIIEHQCQMCGMPMSDNYSLCAGCERRFDEAGA